MSYLSADSRLERAIVGQIKIHSTRGSHRYWMEVGPNYEVLVERLTSGDVRKGSEMLLHTPIRGEGGSSLGVQAVALRGNMLGFVILCVPGLRTVVDEP
ncbi:hypothetical protein Moror_8774 [Moniliophthora roreri MCA 2997]|uniref:Uncharacterized protein n=1 Tax=Moniliophthora roreri (strain MCA 2997) TaxID=1381753 RepID=V2WT06_MONRO|nr:hypothetical protein Moror_8774 [Moniliophthora roreri MCA 2997]